MPHGRALRTLNVNPGTMQKPVDFKTLNAAFSCTENDITAKQCILENLKNVQLLKEKIVKQLEQEALVVEQQAASTSKLDPPLDSPETSSSLKLDPPLDSPKTSESSNISRTEESDDSNHFPSTGLLCSSPDMHESSDTSAVENTSKVSGSLASSSNNIIADLHEKLCSSQTQNKKRANRKRSKSSDTDDSLPLLNTIVNEILSLEVDFPLPSTSNADTCNNRSSVEGRKRSKRQNTRRAPKRGKKQRKMASLASNIPSALVDNAPSSNSISVLSDSDSDCEITGYVPSSSQHINAFPEVHCRNATQLNVHDQSVLELEHTPGPLVSEENSENANHTNARLNSLINILNGSIQRAEDDDILVLGAILQRGREQTNVSVYETFLDRSVIEIGTSNVGRQQTPPVIVVSDDESEPSAKPALKKQSKPTVIELSSQQDAASSSARKWECPICWEELTSVRGVYSTMCGHVFCDPCITHILKTTKKCPMCRESLNKKKVHPLFLDG